MSELLKLMKEHFNILNCQISILTKEVLSLTENQGPSPEWYTLDKACERKGINKKTTQNKPYLQPNNGTPDGSIGGRKAWRRKTIEKWIKQEDKEMSSCSTKNSEGCEK